MSKNKVNTTTTINKVSGKQKEDLLSVLSNHLPKEELEKITNNLMENNIISGSGRVYNSLILPNENGDEFIPSLTWKPRIDGIKIGEKSPQMVTFLERFNELKTSFKKEVK